MEKEKYLVFLNDINKDKPNEFKKINMKECPFCNREKLTDIIAEKGPFILLKNKYPTIKDTYQLVLIEAYSCDNDMGQYSAAYMEDLIRFGVKHWLKIEDSGEYKSVIFYKNHGPNSGGSLKHPHMQIVGLHDIDYKLKIKDEHFEGIEVHKSDNCLVNLSHTPFNGFTEFNIIIKDDLYALNELAYSLKKVVHYLLNNYFVKCDSFNIFFYHLNEKIICKVMPRFTSSPLLLGYGIKQISSCESEIADKLKFMYFQ
jgi:ATP adenylyltransferase/5',5'''-P-1,P-4-tetraphosphate phosphorylase II